MDVTGVLAAALGAGATTLVAAIAVLLGRWRAKSRKFPSATPSPQFDIDAHDLDYFDIASIDFLELRTWNTSQPLREGSIAQTVELSEKPPQEWVDQEGLEQIVGIVEAERSYQPAFSLVAFETDNAAPFRLTVVRDSYAHYVAIRQYLEVAERMAQVRDYVRQHSIEDVVAHSPLSIVAVNVTVVAEGSILIMRRSNAVSTFRGYWQTGPHKSLGYNPDGEPEDVLELARRALSEEVGLEPDDYDNNVVFSWFGMYLQEAAPYAFAHVSTRLTKHEVERRVVAATAAYETADGGERVDWLPVTVDSIETVTDTWRKDPSGRSDASGRRYLPHAVISLRQLVRIISLVNE